MGSDNADEPIGDDGAEGAGAQAGMLAGVRDGIEGGPPRLILYGDPGEGKSTLAAHSPGSIFIPTEDGLRRIACKKFPVATSYGEFIGRLGQVAREEHGFQTLVVDSLGWLEKLIHADVGMQQKKDFAEIGYGKGPEFALKNWKEVVGGLNYIAEERNMGIILIGHAAIEKYSDPESESYDRITLALEKRASAYIREWSDAVLYATRRKRVAVEDLGFNKTRATAKSIGANGGDRILRCSSSPACVAKNRYGIVGDIPMSWDELAKYLA